MAVNLHGGAHRILFGHARQEPFPRHLTRAPPPALPRSTESPEMAALLWRHRRPQLTIVNLCEGRELGERANDAVLIGRALVGEQWLLGVFFQRLFTPCLPHRDEKQPLLLQIKAG